jgi:hypothetical protein
MNVWSFHAIITIGQPPGWLCSDAVVLCQIIGFLLVFYCPFDAVFRLMKKFWLLELVIRILDVVSASAGV